MWRGYEDHVREPYSSTKAICILVSEVMNICIPCPGSSRYLSQFPRGRERLVDDILTLFGCTAVVMFII